MRLKSLGLVGIFFCMFLINGCASLNTNLGSPMKTTIIGKHVIIFPFQDPYYKGRQIQGIGLPFATVFVNKLQSLNVLSDLARSSDFPTSAPINIQTACNYARNNNFDILIIGVVTEWIDGATQWSGTVDVAALTVNIYVSDSCDLVGSASGKQTGTWVTFVNAPTTRFFEPLSENIITTLLNQVIH